MIQRGNLRSVALVKIGLTLAFALFGFEARAAADDAVLLCLNSVESPGGLEEWRVACKAGPTIYADVRFRPISMEKGEIMIHVTEHEACRDGQSINCQVNNSGSRACFGEISSPWIEYDGYASGASIVCGCYDEGTSQCDE
jgi:hypothetical protein